MSDFENRVTERAALMDTRCVIIAKNDDDAKKIRADAQMYDLRVDGYARVLYTAGPQVRIQRLLLVHATRVARSAFDLERERINREVATAEVKAH